MADLHQSALGATARPARSGPFASAPGAALAATTTATKVRYALYNEDAVPTSGKFNGFGEPNTDLLMTGGGQDVGDSIVYDQIALVGTISALPKDVGKEMVFSRKSGNLFVQYCSQAQDISGSAPVGNHDLIKSSHLEVTTGIKQPFVAVFDTIFRHGDEHFYGNSEGSNDPGTRSVAHVFMPSDFDVKGSASQAVIDRTITNSMRIFLKRFPGQTADTLSEYATVLKNSSDVLVRYSTNPQLPTSAVTMWYDALVDGKGERLHPPLKETNTGLAHMPKDVYDKCEALARIEISKYVSLGDMTSENFAIRLKAFAINGKSQLGINEFAYHHPGLDPNTKVPDPATGELITAQALFDKTPISVSLRVFSSYKKVNNGNSL